jgi:hypothetical protein
MAICKHVKAVTRNLEKQKQRNETLFSLFFGGNSETLSLTPLLFSVCRFLLYPRVNIDARLEMQNICSEI